MKIFGDTQSGNCYKVKLLCSLLGISHQWVPVDILAGETSTAQFLSKNPTGKIPLLELADGRCLSESNAILNFLAVDSDLLPRDPFELAKVQQWQFFEQYSHEPYIAVARLGSTPLLRTLPKRGTLCQRSVHDTTQKIQPRIQTGSHRPDPPTRCELPPGGDGDRHQSQPVDPLAPGGG